MGKTVTIDGHPVAVGTAAAFTKLAAAFAKATGYTLHVTSGIRTPAEQDALYRAWMSGAGSLAVPSTSPNARHVSTNPAGPIALDVHDSGTDAGVASAGNARSDWIRENATAHGFAPAGYNFHPAEPWHIEYQGDPWATPAPTTTKGTRVMNAYHYQDRTAKALPPGKSVNMMDGKDQRNIIGAIGAHYTITPHVYVEQLAPGDQIDLVLVWRNAKNAKDSNHYVETLVADKAGVIRATREFKRGVAAGDQVLIRVTAHATNAKTGRVTLIDSDAYNLG